MNADKHLNLIGGHSMKHGVTNLIATAYTLDKINRKNGVITNQTYMGSLPWGKIAFCAGLSLFNSALSNSNKYRYHSVKRRRKRNL